MNLRLLDMPDDPQDWPAWLENQLVSPGLGDLVEQLTVVLELNDTGPSLHEICGPQLPQILQQGLGVLTADQARRLLKHPQRLLELQEQLRCCGGSFWILPVRSGGTRRRLPPAVEIARAEFEAGSGRNAES